jgi:hypothetical protein
MLFCFLYAQEGSGTGSEESEEAGDVAPGDGGPALPAGPDVNATRFSEGEHVSIVDGDDNPVAHGFIQDIEPDVEQLFEQHDNMHATYKQPGLWYVVVINQVVRNCTAVSFQDDTVFAADGSKLNGARGRSLSQSEGLPSLADGFLAFWQIIVKRRRNISKPSKQARNKPSAKPSKKKASKKPAKKKAKHS